ncbi:MAG: helix-turn-helix transcriptional regulator [Elusimicrobia bacterium]|nr:helix-turn-helix transcriptional regulator [Elusimicrobiota bacterium]
MKNRPLPFADRVQSRMRERGLGLRELCRAVELDPSFFSKVLAGKRSPPSDETDLRRIAQVLEVDAPSLIVAAGRIPTEWRRLWDDRALFERIHRLAMGADAGVVRERPTEPERAPRPSSWDRRETAAAAPKQLGEELL